MKTAIQTPDPVRLIVRVAQAVLQDSGPFESYADLKEILKGRLAKLRIPYDGALVAAALDRLEMGGAVQIIHPPPVLKPTLVEQPPEPSPITKGFAWRFMQQLGLAVKAPRPAFVATDPGQVEQEEAEARQRANEMGIDW